MQMLLVLMLSASAHAASLGLGGNGQVDAKSGGSGKLRLDVGGRRRRLLENATAFEDEEYEEDGRRLSGKKHGKFFLEGFCAVRYSGHVQQTSVRSGLSQSVTLIGDVSPTFTFDFTQTVPETNNIFRKVVYCIDISNLDDDFSFAFELEGAYDRAVREGDEQSFTVHCTATETKQHKNGKTYPISETENATFQVDVIRTECEEEG